ncbi:MAG TPA: preprotein translocase subunit YajC [Candidatus Scybalocola faecipullorum]|nr:preprotein translocase subunit YajC [Candidatus Scybalocola faecipullorum]
MDSSSSMGGISGIVIIVIYIAIFALLMYFIAIRPQRKQQKKQDALLASIEVGDSILTTSGFYGVIIDITDEVVVVEFGNNKNCRIPMQKAAIVQVEKANSEE